MLEIIQLPVLSDNYIYIIHEPNSKETAVVDPAIAQPVIDLLNGKGWNLNYILNTHHHSDHVGANLELKKQTGCQIIGFGQDAQRIPGIDITLKQGDEVKLGNQIAKVIATPGHTLGHIVYYFAESLALFCGDTLFSMGCGRLFEGTAEQMWHSLQLLKNLPKQTKIYCAHEYTQDNSKFALTLEPDNKQLIKRIEEVNSLRTANKTTIPSSLEQELMTNPFLREDSLALQESIDMVSMPAVEVFRKIRKLKDNF
ncbi:MAG: hydroxyacylglutathione hydrolase [Methylococcaceae bacterium]